MMKLLNHSSSRLVHLQAHIVVLQLRQEQPNALLVRAVQTGFLLNILHILAVSAARDQTTKLPARACDKAHRTKRWNSASFDTTVSCFFVASCALSLACSRRSPGKKSHCQSNTANANLRSVTAVLVYSLKKIQAPLRCWQPSVSLAQSLSLPEWFPHMLEPVPPSFRVLSQLHSTP